MTETDFWQTSPDRLELSFTQCMRAVAQDHGKTPLAQTLQIVSLALGPGKLGPREYFYYRLFEPRYDDKQRRAFVGMRLQQNLHRLTCKPGSWVVAHDKLICYSLLQSLGYPIPQVRAVYRRGADFPAFPTFGESAGLARALRSELTGPLFGKPIRGIRSGGVLSIEGYDSAADSVCLTHGKMVAVDELVAALQIYDEEGYMLQDRIRQHPAVAVICGDAIATARVLVLLGAEGPKISHAVWKIPVGVNVADNFWRKGNILAAIDSDSGQVGRAISGFGTDLREVNAHPTSGEPLTGFALPDWLEVCRLLLSAARAFPELRMQAWDVAFGADGPVLVEVNVGGDYNLPQLATGRGMLDASFLAFLHECAAKHGMERFLAKLKLSDPGD